MPTIKIANPYDRLYSTKKTRILEYSPRSCGKSTGMAQFLQWVCINNPEKDILVTRANYNALDDSFVQEILDVQDKAGLDGFFRKKVSPLRMTTPLGNNIIFKGIGGADYSRTRGLKTRKGFALAIIEEAQQLPNELNLKHAMSTISRNMMPGGKIIIAGNPHEIKGHWWNQFCKRMRNSDKYEFIDATYLDIWDYLPEETKEEIETEREYNPAMYKFMYLGSLDELQGGAYASFKRENHLKTEEELGKMFKAERFEYVIFGGDGAIVNDATCICPIAIMSSGRAVVLERFYYSPKDSGIQLANTQIVELIKQYLEWMENKYGFIKNEVRKIWSVDCAAGDLIAQLRYELDNTNEIYSFSQKQTQIRTNSVVNDAFAKNVCYIKDTNGQYLWQSGRTMQVDPLIEQLESVVWKNYKLDDAIPNDCTDALTYGINYYYLNPENLDFPRRKIAYSLTT